MLAFMVEILVGTSVVCHSVESVCCWCHCKRGRCLGGQLVTKQVHRAHCKVFCVVMANWMNGTVLVAGNAVVARRALARHEAVTVDYGAEHT